MKYRIILLLLFFVVGIAIPEGLTAKNTEMAKFPVEYAPKKPKKSKYKSGKSKKTLKRMTSQRVKSRKYAGKYNRFWVD